MLSHSLGNELSLPIPNRGSGGQAGLQALHCYRHHAGGWKFPVDSDTIDFVLTASAGLTADLEKRGNHSLEVARLKPGISTQQADAELTTILGRLSNSTADTNLNWTLSRFSPLHADLVGNLRPALLILLGAVVLVLPDRLRQCCQFDFVAAPLPRTAKSDPDRAWGKSPPHRRQFVM